MNTRIIFIDSNIIEYQNLIPQLPENVEAVILNANQDGVAQILAALQSRSEFNTIDIISHGKPGMLLLGSGALNSDNLQTYAPQLREIGNCLKEGGDILLYGCEAGQGKAGQAFIEQLALATGANVAASTNLTGAAELGGNWMLEARTGEIRVPALQLIYPGVLADITGTTGNDVLNGTANDDTITGGLGNDVLIGGTGNDVAVFSGNQSDYEFSINASNEITIRDINLANGNEGTDKLTSIQIARFVDGDVTISRPGGEFLVNSHHVPADQDAPSIAGGSDGGVMVTWMSYGQDIADGSANWHIYARRFAMNGAPQGDEFQVNSISPGNMHPAITALANGGYVIGWITNTLPHAIVARRYDSNGVPQGGEFQVNISPSVSVIYYSTLPTITALNDGGFLVTWVADGLDGSGFGVFARRFDADGNAVINPITHTINEFPVNTFWLGDQQAPAAAALVDGGFVISWESQLQNGDGLGIYAQRFAADGTPLGGELQVNTTTAFDQVDPGIAGLSDGGFIVCWTSYQSDGTAGIYAQRYDANGMPHGNELSIAYGYNQLNPVVAALTDGGFVIAYESDQQDDNGTGIFARRFDASGLPLGDEFQVNTQWVGHQMHPAITALTDGGFVVSWRSNDMDSMNIYAQRYDAEGNPAGDLQLEGSVNADRLKAAAALTLPIHLSGLDGHDSLQGGGGDDHLDGGSGNDTLNGGAGADKMTGGLGNDTFTIDHAEDLVAELFNEGTDKINSSVTYVLPANVENLTLTGAAAIDGTGNELPNKLLGNAAANQLTGGDGNDTLDGKTGIDTLTGGSGNDSYIVDNAADAISENLAEGTDKVSSNVTYTLPANVENLTLTGSAAIDGTGNAQANTLTGSSGNNVLNGGGGNDTLDGKGGANTLTGGAGKDKFKFTTSGHTGTITDFVVVDDTIQLENAVFTSLTTTGKLAADQFRIGVQAGDVNDYVIYNNATGAILYDADGNGAGAAVQIAAVGVSLAMTSADIVVI